MRTSRWSVVGVSLLVFAVCFLLVVAGFSKKTQTQRQSLEIGSGPRGAGDLGDVARLERFRLAVPDLKKGFVAKVAVSLKSERSPALADVVELPWRAPNLNEPASGWTRRNDRFVWLPGSGRAPLVVPFFNDRSRSALRLSDFDELWVDYRDSAGRNACVPSAGITLRSDNSAIAFNAEPLADVKTIDVAGVRWSKKDYRYSFGRILGLPPDDIWRYTQFGRFMVLQRRLHEDARDLAEMSLVFGRSAPVVHINFRIKFGDSPGPAELFQLGETATSVDSLGRTVARVDMRQIIGSRIDNPEMKVYLQEITIFVRGEEKAVISERPLKKIDLYHGSLLGRIEAVAPLRSRFVLDLRTLPPHKEWLLSSGRVRFAAYGSEGHCDVQLENIRLASYFDKGRPSFLREGPDLIRRWGGPFIVAIDSGTRSEWPRVIGHLSFESALLTGKSTPESSLVERRSIRGTGYEFHSDKAFTDVVLTTSGLVLQGSGKWIELGWPISVRLNRDSRFFAALTDRTQAISKSVLTVELADGRSISMASPPNQQVLLDAGLSRIKTVRLRMDLNRSPYRLTFKEAALFSPVLLTAEEAFDERRPVGTAMRSIHQDLGDWIASGVGDEKSAFELRDRSLVDIVKHPISLAVGGEGLVRIIAGRISPVEHPYFQLNSVTVEPRALLSLVIHGEK